MHAARLLDVDRAGVDGKMRIGPLSGVHRHSDKVRSIQLTAVKTLSEYAEGERKKQVLSADVDALRRQDGSFSAIADLREDNPIDPKRPLEIGRDQRRDAAVRQFIGGVREKNGGVPNFEEEFGVLMRNGVKHPEYERLFDETYRGVLGTNDASPEQIAKIQQVAQFYSKIADRNWAYAQSHVSSQAKEFFETYRSLTRFLGRSPEAAAAETAMAFGNSATSKDPMVVQTRLNTIRDKISAMDFSKWPFLGSVVNRGTVEQMLVPIATALARVEGVDADTVIERAVEHIKSRGAYVNNRVVFAPGISRGDEEFVQPILDRVFKENSAYLKEQGVEDGSHLSIAPYGEGFVVVKWDGGILNLPTYKQGGAAYIGEEKYSLGLFPRFFTSADIQKIRNAGRVRAEAEAVAKLKADDEFSRKYGAWGNYPGQIPAIAKGAGGAVEAAGRVVRGIAADVEGGLEAISKARKASPKPKPLGKR